MTQEYASTKIVTAWHAQAPNSGGKGDDGYGVKYKNGHISWSPVDAFEEASIPLGNISHLPEHLQQMISQYAVLMDKLHKLQEFIDSPKFLSHVIDVDERARMNLQESLMARFAEVLGQRIKFHTEKLPDSGAVPVVPPTIELSLGALPGDVDVSKVTEAVTAKLGDVVYQEDVYELDAHGDPVVNTSHDGHATFVIKHHKGTPVIQEPMKFGDEFNFNKADQPKG